jgi:hypothetical protein
MKMILVKANLVQHNAWHTPQHLTDYFFSVGSNARIQDPAAVFRDPADVILRMVLLLSPPQLA